MLKDRTSKANTYKMNHNLNRKLFMIQNYLCRRETGLELSE